jgi:hypothetical protein
VFGRFKSFEKKNYLFFVHRNIVFDLHRPLFWLAPEVQYSGEVTIYYLFKIKTKNTKIVTEYYNNYIYLVALKVSRKKSYLFFVHRNTVFDLHRPRLRYPPRPRYRGIW